MRKIGEIPENAGETFPYLTGQQLNAILMGISRVAMTHGMGNAEIRQNIVHASVVLTTSLKKIIGNPEEY